MKKALVKLMEPDVVSKRHCNEAQQVKLSLDALLASSYTWTEANLDLLNFIDELIVDMSKGHGTLQEVTAEVEKLQAFLTRQKDQLEEARQAYPVGLKF